LDFRIEAILQKVFATNHVKHFWTAFVFVFIVTF